MTWGSSITFKVHRPTSGGWYTYDLEVISGPIVDRYTDLQDDSTRWRRLVHRTRNAWRWLRSHRKSP